MDVLKDLKNELLGRREVKIVVPSEKNPSFDEAIKFIAAEFKTPDENIDISGIKGKFGRKTFLISANVYDSKESKEKAEIKTKKQRKAEAEEAKKADEEKKAPAEEKPAPATEEKPASPAEEKKDESKPAEEAKTE